MAVADDILGRNVANPTTLDLSGLAGDDIPGGNLGGLQVSPAGPSAESTLSIDPNSLIDSGQTPGFDPGNNVIEDIDLAQTRVAPAKATSEPSAANENAAAVGGVAGTAVKAGVSVWNTVDTLKAGDKIFMDKIQRGYETLEFNQRMIRNAGNMSALNASLNAIDSLNKQGGNVAAGGQEQLFLRSPNSGRQV